MIWLAGEGDGVRGPITEGGPVHGNVCIWFTCLCHHKEAQNLLGAPEVEQGAVTGHARCHYHPWLLTVLLTPWVDLRLGELRGI